MIPAHHRAFAPEWQQSTKETDAKIATHKDQVESYYNYRTKALPELRVGSHVAVQDPHSKLWNLYGVVVDIGPYRRYFVKMTNGHILTRNRRFLRRRIPLSPATGSSAPNVATALPALPTRHPIIAPNSSLRKYSPAADFEGGRGGVGIVLNY